MTRPWSPAEIEEMVPGIIEALDEAVLEFRTLTETAAEKVRVYKRARSVAWLRVQGSNAPEREARVNLHQIEPGVEVGQLEYEADLAEGVVKAQRQHIAALQTKAELTRTLLVSARATTAN